ncbi:hypothetical protein [Nocardioides terrigena]|uniref:hypothetical protein n=1 Tax=Nocardioides terrigena TaxID=424797 RepID=UPI000D2FB324|nr:hypothetical protein [Nocardioides terrigena]
MNALWFLLFLPVAALALVAIVTPLAPKPPRVTSPTDDHMRVAVENTSATPIYEALAVEIFRREIDEKLRDGLAGWGSEDVA